MAILYALCLLTPAGALAANQQAVTAQCLGEHQHSAAGSAVQPADHAGHARGEPADHGQTETCCGMFGVTALAPEFQAVAIERTQSSGLMMPRAASLLGNGGDRIDRPPRDLLSL